MTQANFSDRDAELLEKLQTRFPIVERPYRLLAERVGLSEEQVVSKIAKWLDAGVIRRIGASVDARRIGFTTTLVGAAVEPSAVDQVAEKVSQQRWVSHNYLRHHRVNLWFTLTTPSEAVALQLLEELASEPGVGKIYPFPTIRLFKLSVRFNPRTRKGDSTGGGGGSGRYVLSEVEKAVLRALQAQIPAEPEPYHSLARSAGLEVPEFLGTLVTLVRHRVVRRLGATLNHHKLGVDGNAMVVWQVPEERIEEAGRYLASQPEISHAYQRPTYPDWPYSLYTMVHARDDNDLTERLRRWEGELRPTAYLPLRTIREYKKQPVRLFD